MIDNKVDNEMSEELLDHKAKQRKSDATFYLVLGLLVTIVLLVRIFAFSTYIVIGESMYPTLQDGDRVWVNKTATPQRGDIVVTYAENDQKALIKRVVAVPGDVIYTERAANDTGYVVKIVTSDGTILDESYIGIVIPNIDYNYLGMLASPVKVDGYFLMGDNRNNSRDSRDPARGIFYPDEIVGIVVKVT